MRNVGLMLLTVLVVVSLAACASTPIAHSGPAANAPVAPSLPDPVVQPPPTANGRVEGTVQSADRSEVTLQDGEHFSLGAGAPIIRSEPAAALDLQPGEFVAVTAKRQVDDTLLASVINIFPESLRGLGEGQRPMNDDNLMTNATITDTPVNLMTNATVDDVRAGGFGVSFPGGTDQVRLASDVEIHRFEAADPTDLTPGTAITAFVTNGAAQFITIM